MEIDVSKCRYYCEKYDGCYCFNSSKEIYAVNPNEHNSCEANNDCYYKQLQQLKAYIKEDLAPTCQRLQKENEELKYLVFSWEEINKIQEKYEQCLDEIEAILKEYSPLFTNTPLYMINQLIKQAKEGGEC